MQLILLLSRDRGQTKKLGLSPSKQVCVRAGSSQEDDLFFSNTIWLVKQDSVRLDVDIDLAFIHLIIGLPVRPKPEKLPDFFFCAYLDFTFPRYILIKYQVCHFFAPAGEKF